MSKKTEIAPKSLRVYHKGLLDPSREHCCFACDRELKVGFAWFLLVDEEPKSFGPKCAEDFSSQDLRGIPDTTKDIEFLSDDCAEPGIRKSFSRRSGALVRKLDNPVDETVQDAVIYALLRVDYLPALGFDDRRLAWAPLVKFLESYKRGDIDPSLLSTVNTTAYTTSRSPAWQFLSPDNLRACHAYAWLFQKIDAEKKKRRFFMSSLDFKSFEQMKRKLKADMFLDEAGCDDAFRIAKNYLEKPPKAFRPKFVASNKPKLVPGRKSGRVILPL